MSSIARFPEYWRVMQVKMPDGRTDVIGRVIAKSQPSGRLIVRVPNWDGKDFEDFIVTADEREPSTVTKMNAAAKARSR